MITDYKGHHAAESSVALKSTEDTFICKEDRYQKICTNVQTEAYNGHEKEGKAIHSFNAYPKNPERTMTLMPLKDRLVLMQ